LSDYENTSADIATAEFWNQIRRRNYRREHRSQCDQLIAELEDVNLKTAGKGRVCSRSVRWRVWRFQDEIEQPRFCPRNTVDVLELVFRLQQSFMLTPSAEIEAEDSELASSPA
jgi:hypothetical protein